MGSSPAGRTGGAFMAIQNNRLTNEQYEANFADIRPPFERPSVPLKARLRSNILFLSKQSFNEINRVWPF
jgi:hypothetical protein